MSRIETSSNTKSLVAILMIVFLSCVAYVKSVKLDPAGATRSVVDAWYIGGILETPKAVPITVTATVIRITHLHRQRISK